MPQDTYDFNRIDLNEIYSLFHTKDERRLDSVKEFIEAENYMKAIQYIDKHYKEDLRLTKLLLLCNRILNNLPI